MWTMWSAQNPTNNMMIRKVQREAFFAGAEITRDHFHSSERLAAEYINENQLGLTLVGGTESDE